jgi:hypothetical protein
MCMDLTKILGGFQIIYLNGVFCKSTALAESQLNNSPGGFFDNPTVHF